MNIKVAAGTTKTQHWDLDDARQWYDFEVTSSNDSSFYRRFAGRLETGLDSVTDPAQA